MQDIWIRVALGVWVSFALVGCKSERAEAVLSCASQQQCAANGKMYCDLAAGLCKACVGSCPWEGVGDGGATVADGGAVTSPGSVVAGSCLGKCGLSAGTCFCDPTCKCMNDCCADFEQVCSSSTVGLLSDCSALKDAGRTSGGSCVGACGLSSGNCFCNPGCQAVGNCCSDYAAVCLADASTSSAD